MGPAPLVTVIVPVWRDAEALGSALHALAPDPAFHVVVAGVLGDDEADRRAMPAERTDIEYVAGPRGRAAQMNAGAALARGRWLVFLHADSRLPPRWLDVVRAAASQPAIVGGSFRLALDSGHWRARLIEWAVRARVAAFGLPYGDQALFVRADVFAALGGYRDWPLMEDVDLVRRLKQRGRLLHASARVVTSARRWERDGWTRRSAGNVALLCRFLLGADPARLAQRYFRRHPRAIVVMARAPWTAGKTRLAPVAGDRALAELREALFADTLEAACTVDGAQHIVACLPAEAVPRLRSMTGPGVDVIAQRGAGLGARLAHAFDDTFRLGAEAVVAIGSDLPDLPPDRLVRAFDALAADPAAVVLGPAGDGGYYLIGMCRPHPGLFEGIDWSTPRVLAQTREAAQGLGLPIVLLEGWCDVDEPADLERLRAATGARRTRAWLGRSPA